MLQRNLHLPLDEHPALDGAVRRFAKSHNIRAIARYFRRNEAVVVNKFNGNQDHHRLGVKETIEYTKYTEDYTIAEGFCAELGGVFVKVDSVKGTGRLSNADIADRSLDLVVSAGDTAKTGRDLRDGGKLTLLVKNNLTKKYASIATQSMALLLGLEDEFRIISAGYCLSDLATGVVA